MIQRLITTLILCGLCLTLGTAVAQELDKATLKEWKRKQRKMDTEEFYQKMTEYQRLKRDDNMAKRQVNSLSNEISRLNKRIAELEGKLKKQGGDTTKKENATPPTITDAGEDYNQGVVFRVQIGAFRNKDLTKFTNHPRFHAETDGDCGNGENCKKYTIANFRDYWEADLFKKYLREMGVEDAWIVSYRDGVRTDIADVLGEEEIKAIKERDEAAKTEGGEDGGDGW